ncbi:hypothetical protein V8J88_00800 [Massilia sp. W12]|uniref:hypothetical protein n=1 Tax=Massilia sp. W12 TaxID=3126507 RepID=UPI0030D1F664
MRKSLQERYSASINAAHAVLCLINLTLLLELLRLFPEIRYGGIMLYIFLPAYLLCSLLMLWQRFRAKAGPPQQSATPAG